MREYVTSDWHFFHNNIMGSDGFTRTRKHFTTVEEMNQAIVDAINKVVTNRDTLYHLGDIGMNVKPKDLYETVTQIRGQIHLFKGNHDGSKVLKYFRNNNYKLKDGRDKFVIHEIGIIKKSHGKVYYLTHYPIGLGEQRRDLRSICGHIHETYAKEANVINVGIDSPELPPELPFAQPIELSEAMALIERKWELWYNKGGGEIHK